MRAARLLVTKPAERGGEIPPPPPTDSTPSRRESDLREDTELIRRVQGGEREAFGFLVRRHLQRAYAVAFRVVQHREDAEDMVQEAFVSALRHIDRFELAARSLPGCTASS